MQQDRMDHAEAVVVLKKLYAAKRSGFGAEDCDQSDNLTYGELTPNGMRSLVKAARFTESDVFADLGSGTGKLLVYAALRWLHTLKFSLRVVAYLQGDFLWRRVTPLSARGSGMALQDEPTHALLLLHNRCWLTLKSPPQMQAGVLHRG